MKVHFVGIGGSGMSSLAGILVGAGEVVTGCDRVLNAQTAELERKGVTIWHGHDESHLDGVDCVVVTKPVMNTSEVLSAIEKGLKVVDRAELLGQLMNGKKGIAIAGTHGKTTTTALVAEILIRSDVDPTVLVGGVPVGWEIGGRYGKDEWMVAEADEYARSFLWLHPELAVITNIEHDHPDIFPTECELVDAFSSFLRGMKPDGKVFVCKESSLAIEVVKGIASTGRLYYQTYGVDGGCDWSARVTRKVGGVTCFDVIGPDFMLEGLKTSLPGRHNLINIVGAVAVGINAGASPEGVKSAIQEFRGVKRRFEYKGESKGVIVLDDYAHHPTEIAATISAAREYYPGRQIFVAFQPHTYSRTKTFLAHFAEALKLADKVFLLDVYAAREQPDPDLDLDTLLRMIGNNSERVGNVEEASHIIPGFLVDNSVLITMGAGDVTNLGPKILEEFGEM